LTVDPLDEVRGHYDRQGNPISLRRWLELWDRPHPGSYSRIALSEQRSPDGEVLQVSTVWLGIDHSFGGGPPLIFETMVFGPDGDELGVWRWATEAMARDGHARLARAVLVPNRWAELRAALEADD
jgi:hypothetical protein